MKRILAAALSLALLVSLAACGGKDRFDAGKVEEGVCYQLTGIAPDAVAMKVDGIDVPMDMYFYNLCYAASYMESYMNMYGMDLDWSMELQEGETVLDVTKDSILENTKSFAVIEKLAQENNVILDEAALSELEAERAETVESLGGEESYRAELAKLGLSEETYDRMCRSDYLYSALEELAATEGSSLYATDEQLIAYAAEQGYMTADHILLLTRDMSTYQELDDETKAEKKAPVRWSRSVRAPPPRSARARSARSWRATTATTSFSASRSTRRRLWTRCARPISAACSKAASRTPRWR